MFMGQIMDKQPNPVLAHEFHIFTGSDNSCSVERSRPNLFSFSLLPFLKICWQTYAFPNTTGFDH